jgi:FkbM family methyltransferase
MLEKNKVWIQIGVKDGNDEFRDLAREYCPSKIILVEPNKELLENIKNSYKGINNAVIVTLAITADEKGEVNLYRPAKVINGIEYDPGKFSLIPMDDWGNDFITMTVDSCTFNQLCYHFNIDDINFLQIDTEGYDSEIIRSIDLDKIKIDVLKYEVWNHDSSCYKRHGINEYGKTGIEIVNKMLSERGYRFQKVAHDMIAYVES